VRHASSFHVEIRTTSCQLKVATMTEAWSVRLMIAHSINLIRIFASVLIDKLIVKAE